MSDIAAFIYLAGDEDGGVTVVCDHADHLAADFAIAYYGGLRPIDGVPYFAHRQLGDLVALIQRHSSAHED